MEDDDLADGAVGTDDGVRTPRGTRFALPHATVPAPAHVDARPTVLAVDDDAVVVESLARLARGAGHAYRYEFASSCADGIERLASNRYSAVIVDYVLDDGFGTDLVAFARGVPVIVMTGQGSEKVAIEALRAGAYDYLMKDFDGRFVDLIQPTLERVFARREAELAEQQHAAELLRTVRENRELERYASMVAGMLQTPLQVVQHYCALLGTHPPVAQDRLAARYADAAFEGARRANAVVTEALELSRVATAGGGLVPTDLELACRDALREVAVEHPLPAEAVEVSELPDVIGDPAQLRMLFRRLVARIERSSRAAGRPVSARIYAHRTAAELRVVVEDTSCQQQTGADDDDSSVWSLEFATCQRIVERHSGRLWFGVGSAGGEAALFTIGATPQDNRGKNP